jgi:hypothetical protein
MQRLIAADYTAGVQRFTVPFFLSEQSNGIVMMTSGQKEINV